MPPRWLHRLAGLTAAATLALIAVGGLVTSTGSGMAVPDWPTSGGRNLFSYPWFRAARAQFIEHGHRLAGATVGACTLALAFGLWARDPRRWAKELGLLAAAAVLLQGKLGGLRVLMNDRTLAFLHACLAHAFFALMAVLYTVTSAAWLEAVPVAHPGTRGLRRACAAAAVLVYVQILLGATVRQLGRPYLPHLTSAALLTILVCWVAMLIHRDHLETAVLSRAATWLAAATLLQAVLGMTAARGHAGPAGVAHATAHVVLGALLLGLAVRLALLSARWLR